MTNQAILAILDHLSNQARDSIHSAQGLLQVLCETGAYRGEASRRIGSDAMDQMLQFIDDARELASREPAPASEIGAFDPALSLGEIVEVFNLASRDEQPRIELEARRAAQVLLQDRTAMEQGLTRLIGALRRLGGSSTLRIAAWSASDSALVTISASEPDVFCAVADWLAADWDTVTLEGPLDIPDGVTVMAAAKKLRGLDAEISASGGAITIRIPSKDASDVELTGLAETDRLNILVTEDCDESFALLALMLRGEQIERANDGLEALELVKRHRFDVVFMDVYMDRMDGYAAIRAIRNWETESGNARTPVVILSSDRLETQKRNAAQSGCAGYLRKPVRHDDLACILTRLRELRATASLLH